MKFEFCVKTFPYLGDHRIFDKPIVSAATIIRSLMRNGDSSLDDLSFVSFIPLDGILKLAVNGNRLNLLSDEKIVFSALRSEKENVELEMPKFQSAEETIEGKQFYKTMNGIGYEHLASFRTVESLRFGRFEDKFYGIVKLRAGSPMDCQLDGLFQSMAFLLHLFGSFPRQLLVPGFLKKFRCNFSAKNAISIGKFVLDLKTLNGDFELFGNDDLIFIGKNLEFRPIQKQIDSAKPMIGIRSISCRLPDGVSTPSEFWTLMQKGKSTDRRIPSERIPNRNQIIEFGVEGGNFIDGDIFGFDSTFFGISAAEATAMDPQQRLILECVYECLEMSGEMGNRRMGVFIGMMGSEYTDGDLDALMMLGSSASTMCGRLSHFFDCRGSSIVVDTACSSSLVALDLAVGKLERGEIDSAIVGGVNLILSDSAMSQRANGKLLSPDGKCQSFDAKANGYGRADGCVVLLVERSVPRRDYFAFVEKIGTNHDGHSSALTVPNGDSQRELIESILQTLPMDKIPIGFWECHGTGTSLGDPIEVNSLQTALSKHTNRLTPTIPLSTAKAFIGHTEAASGLVGVLKAVLQLQNRQIPPLPNFQTLNPHIRLDERFQISGRVQNLAQDSQMRAGVSSFGVGGTNAVTIIRSASPHLIRRSDSILQILPLSAKTPTSLRHLIEAFAEIETPNPLIGAAISVFRPNFPLRAIMRRSADRFSEVFCSFESKPQTFTLSCITNSKTPEFFYRFKKYRAILEEKLSKTEEGKSETVEFSSLISFFLEIGFPSKVLSDISSTKNCGIIQIDFPNQTIKIQTLEDFELAIGMGFVFGKLSIRWEYLFEEFEREDLLSVLKSLPTYPFDRKTFRRSVGSLFDHPFIGNIIESDEFSVRTNGFFSVSRFVQTKITEGTALEAAISLVQFQTKNSALHLREWKFNNPKLRHEIWISASVQKLDNQTIECQIKADEKEIFFEGKFLLTNSPMISSKVSKSKQNSQKRREKTAELLNNFISLQNAKQLDIFGDLSDSKAVNSMGIITENGDVLVKCTNLGVPLNFITEDLTTNSTTTPDNITEKIISSLRQSIVGDLEISEDIGFFDLGLDSLGLVGFANELERNGISVGTADLMANPTIRKLSAFLRSQEETESSGYSSINAEEEQIDSLLFEIIPQPLANRPKVQIVFYLNGKIQIRSGRKQTTILAEKFPKIVEKWKINKMEVSFEESSEFPMTKKLAEYFIKIGHLISSVSSQLEITVKRKSGLLNSMGRAFLKSLCAELSPQISFRFDEKMLPISKPMELRRIPTEWIITGGTSGIGWTMGKHLLEKYGAEKILLLGRKSPPESILSEISKFGDRLYFRSADVSNQNELLKAIREFNFCDFGIIHSAGVSDDSLLSAQNLQTFERVFIPKIDGLINLKKTMEKLKLTPTLWILNSSVSSVLGNIGQTNYAAANAFLDEFANSEKSKGKWICSINWANWLEVGFAATNSIRDILTEKGFFGLRTSEALRSFDRILSLPQLSQIFVAKADWNKMCQIRPELSDFVGNNSSIQLKNPSASSIVQKKTPTKTQIEAFLHKTLHSLLGDSAIIDENMGFMEMGIDSFGLYRFSSLIAEHFNTEIPIISLFENPKISQLSEFISQKLQKAQTEADGKQKPTKPKNPTKIPRRTESADLCPPAASKYPSTSKSTDRPLKVDLATKPPKPKNSQSPDLTLLFGGNGCLYSSICLDLCSKVPFIRRQIRLISEYFRPFLKTSILEIIESNQTTEISSLPIEHAAIFAIGFSLAQFWIHIGLEPKYLIGHSLGEMIAVCVGGFIEPKNAVYLIWLRAKALERSRGKGSMMAVESEFLSRRSISALGLSVSAINSPGQVVLSGSPKSIQKAEFLAKKLELAAKILNTEFGFHSKKILKEEYFKILSKFDWKKISSPNRMTVISNLSATPLQTFDQNYVKEQARNTVQFQKSIEWLLTQGEVTFLEAGPGRILSSLVQKLLNQSSLRYLALNSTQKDQTDELESIKWAAQKLELKGFQIDRREFCSAVGEDYVEEVSNAFGSSIRLDKSASMNVRVAQSVRHKRMENRRRENPLVLNRRNVLADSADREITSAHLLFGDAVAPAAFHLKCFGEHLKLHQIVLRDVRLNRRIPLSDFDRLVTLFKEGRLQLRSTTSDRIFSSCSVNNPGNERNGGIEDPDFPDGDPGIWLSPSKFYEGMAAHGLRYGQKLRLLEDIRLIGMNWIRTRCRKPIALWVLFDVGLQTLSAGLFDIRSPVSFIPIHIGEVFFRFPTQTTDEGQWTMHGEITRRDRDVVEGNVWIFGRGVLIAHLKDIRAVRAHPTKLLKAQQSNRNALSTDEESQDEDPKREQRRQSLGDELSAETTERRAAASTAAKISMALNSLKRTRVQRDFHERQKTKVKMKSIAIRSAYGQFAAAQITEQFSDFAQKSPTVEILRLEWEKEKFDSKFFGIMPKEGMFMDPQQRILLEAVQLCLDKAGIQKCPENCGIYVGISASEFAQKAFAKLKNKVGYLMSGTNSSSLSGRLAHFFGTIGPTMTVDTACSSFLSALCIACDHLSMRKCSWAIVASCNLVLNDETTEVLKNAGVLSQLNRCATFDQSADGYVRTEGVGVLLLERTNDNEGIFVNKWEIGHTGGGTVGFAVPKSDAQCRIMSAVCEDAPDLIECHGSATKVGDKIEIEAIQKFLKGFPRKEVYLTASKAHFGHSEAAAGALSVLTAMNITQSGYLPLLPHFQRLNSDVRLSSNIKIPTENIRRDFRKVMVNSFGFTGTNASILLERRGQLQNKQEKKLNVFNRQHLWPFEELPIFHNIRQYSLHFKELQEKTAFFGKLNNVFVCGDAMFHHNRRIESASSEELKKMTKITVIWTLTESRMEFLALCRFCSLLPPKSTFQLIASQNFATVARAFYLTVIAEKGPMEGGFLAFDDCHVYTVSDDLEIIHQQLHANKPFQKIMVIGGSGGIGRAILERLKPAQAVIVGRSSHSGLFLNKGWKYIKCNMSNQQELFNAVNDELDVDLLIHCAGAVRNDLIQNQTAEHFDEIFMAKSTGIKNSIELCVHLKIRQMVGISSVAGIFGSFGQVNYAVANAEMIRLMSEEKRVKSSIIILGPIADVGMLSGEKMSPIRKQIETKWKLMDVSTALSAIVPLIESEGIFVVAEETENPKPNDYFPTTEENHENVETILCQMITELSGIGEIDVQQPLVKMGADSLIIESLRQKICHHFKISVSPAQMFEHISVGNLTDLIKTMTDDCSTIIPLEPTAQCPAEQSIAVIGFSGEFPKSKGKEEFFEKLLKGEELLTETTTKRPKYLNVSGVIENTQKFDPKFFGLTKEECSQLDPQLRILLKTAFCALDDSGYPRERREKLRIGCVVAAEPSDFPRNPQQRPKGSLLGMFDENQKDFGALWISHLLSLNGPSISVYSACSSSVVAIAQAAQMLRSNIVDLAVVGSIHLVHRIGHEIVSPLANERHCRPFSRDASGLIRGSGCGVLVLRRLDSAISDGDSILAEISAFAVNNDANRRKANFMAPSIEGQTEVISEGLKTTKWKEIDYIECHATGTAAGDGIELQSIRRSFERLGINSKPFLGSVKANIGHSFAASGMMSIAKCLEIFRTHRIPPQINLGSSLLAEFDENFMRIAAEGSVPIEANRSLQILVNNFGIGGTNGVLLMKEFKSKNPQKLVNREIDTVFPLIISAKTVDSCLSYSHSLAEYLNAHPLTDLAALSNTLLHYRDHYRYRFGIIAKNRTEAIQKLKAAKTENISEAKEKTPFALYFGPQGTLYEEILSEECRHSQRLRQQFPLKGKSEATKLIHLHSIICDFLFDFGLPKPDVLIGHSLGEYSALRLSGELFLHSVMEFTEKRSHLISKTPKAKTFLVQTEKTDVGDSLHLMAVLSDELKVFVCSESDAEKAEKSLNGYSFSRIRGDFGFHSELLAPIFCDFRSLCADFPPFRPNIPIISTMNGNLLEDLTADYLMEHLKNSVRLDLSLKTLQKKFSRVKTIIEIGPSGILSSVLDSSFIRIPTVSSNSEYSSLSRLRLFESLISLWSFGFPIELGKLFGKTTEPLNGLPNYVFDEIDFPISTEEDSEEDQNEAEQSKEFRLFRSIWSPISVQMDSSVDFSLNDDIYVLSDIPEVCKLFKTEITFPNSNIQKKKPKIVVFAMKSKSVGSFRRFFSQFSVFFDLIVFTLSDDFSHIVVGDLDDLKAEYPKMRGIHIQLQSFDEIPSIIRLFEKTNFDGFLRFRQIDGFLHQLQYVDVPKPDRLINKKEVYLIVGGNSSLGRALIKKIRLLDIHSEIISLSRKPPNSVGCIHYFVDILNFSSIDSALLEISKKWRKIDKTIFLVGKKPLKKTEKTKEEMEEISAVKIDGYRNLLNSALKNGIHLGSMILSSSLSSVLGISSIGEYSSANSFLDFQTFSLLPSILSGIVSIQLPPLKGSSMLQEDQNPTFEENSISLENAADWILDLKDQSGIFAIFHTNPQNLHDHFNPPKSSNLSVSLNKLKEEQKLGNIWRDSLGIPKEEEILDSDDFFRMGGNSLSSQQMIWRLQREFNANLSSEEFLRNPIFGVLRKSISRFSTLPKIEHILGKEEYAVSWAQEQMWILSQMSPKVYKNVFIIHFEGNFQLDVAQKSLYSLMDRQKTLRSRFYLNSDGEVKQKIQRIDEAFENSVFLDSELDTVLKRELDFEFDLSVETFRFIFVKTKEEKWSAVVNQHHLITDGFSVSIFAAEFSEFYRSFRLNIQPALEPLDIDFVDFAEFDRKNLDESKLEEMKEQLRALSPKGTSIREIEGKSTGSRIQTEIPKQTMDSLNEIQKATGMSRFLIILTAFLRCIDEWRLNAEEPIVIGCPVSGRNFPQISQLISYFLNNLVLIVRETEGLYGSVKDSIGFVAERFREAEYFGDVPFHRCVSALNRSGDLQSVFRIFFNHRDRLDYPTVNLGDDVECSIEQFPSAENFHLAVTVDEMSEGRLRICFGSSELSNSTLRLFSEDLLRHLEFRSSVNTDIQLNEEFLFESLWTQIFAQIQQKPEATAIIQPNGCRLSYGEFGERIQKLCRILESEKNVAIILDFNESVEWIIAATAVRCPFSPMDPNQSDVRLEAMASELNNPLVICRRKLCGFRNVHPDYIHPENLDSAFTELRPSFAQPDDILYVLFTSGSTGRPKAVAVEHFSLAAFIRRSREQFDLNEDSVLGNSVNTTFDVSLFNIFGVLTVGGILLQKERILDFAVGDLDIQLSHLFLTSAIFNSLPKETLRKMIEKTKWLIVGGETPKTESMETVHQNGCRISQIYGPTETTVWVSFRHFVFGDLGKNIGIPFVPFLIVSASDRQIDGNAVGELWIGGNQLARGYLNGNEEFSIITDRGKFYKTGDLVRKNTDKTLEFFGRLDRRIKRRGIGIDPLEIEMAVSKVLSSEFRLLFSGDRILVFFVGEKNFSEDIIQKQLNDYLPPVAVPTDFIALPDGFPINGNGKVDSQKLLSQHISQPNHRLYVVEEQKPEDIYERRLKEIWKSIIGEMKIYSKTNFFESGGDSLSAFRLQIQIQQQFEISIPFGEIYEKSEFGKQLKLLKTHLMKEKDILEEISRSPNPKSTLICFHAIGGQTFSYFFLSKIWPQSDIYAVPFSNLYPIESLSELADFYFQKIRQKIDSTKIILLGHSLGGILGWEISRRFAAAGIRLGPVLAFDSWVVDNEKIDENSVLDYLKEKFSLMKDKDDLITSARRLCLLLKSHKFERDPNIPIILFKAERLTQSPLRKVIRNDLTEEKMRMVADNGWRRLSDYVVVRTLPADHDSIIQPEFLSTQIEFFKFIVKQIE